jgi:hypothetical protein
LDCNKIETLSEQEMKCHFTRQELIGCMASSDEVRLCFKGKAHLYSDPHHMSR